MSELPPPPDFLLLDSSSSTAGGPPGPPDVLVLSPLRRPAPKFVEAHRRLRGTGGTGGGFEIGSDGYRSGDSVDDDIDDFDPAIRTSSLFINPLYN